MFMQHPNHANAEAQFTPPEGTAAPNAEAQFTPPDGTAAHSSQVLLTLKTPRELGLLSTVLASVVQNLAASQT